MYPSVRTESISFNPSLACQANRLATRGYNPAEAQSLGLIKSSEIRKKILETNLATMVNHVFEDSVVSFTNHYQVNNKGEVVSYPNHEVLSIDPDERGGLNAFGISSAVSGALENPHQVVLLYSPPGPVVFDNNPNNKFKEIKPYTDGQLYMMFSDGKKVNNVAISISEEGESWIRDIMPNEYHTTSLQKDEIARVKYCITHPLLTGRSIDDFLNSRWNAQDRIIFRNKNHTKFSLVQTLSLIHQSLAGQLEQSHLVVQVLNDVDIEHITTQDIDHLYGALAQEYMKENKLEKIVLGGSCGGTEIKLDIFSPKLENLSTKFRMMTQGENIVKTSKDTLDCTCPFCNKKVVAKIAQGTITCPKCGESSPYAC